jgi:hypothetical protein
MNKINLNEINWNEIQKKHNDGVFWCNLDKLVGISRTVLIRAVQEGYLKKIIHKKTMSMEAKQKISKGRIKYLKENPDKHPWKNNDKFKSKPCELLKNKLNENNIIYISEYEPSKNRFYSLDIAFPNKKIGIEINGNQHYNRDGTLKDYYIERNKFFISIGWKIYDIHYSVVYNDLLLKTLINDIKNFSLNQNELNFYLNEYIERKIKNEKNHCIDCNIIISKESKRCKSCAAKLRIKVIRPTKEVLFELIKNNNWSELGRMFNVSATTVKDWTKLYNKIKINEI